MSVIDLNADLGEGYAFDRELITIVTSANISTGAYTGDLDAVKRALDWAVGEEVSIGAHFGYRDVENFGRISLAIGIDELAEEISEQLIGFYSLVVSAGAANGFDYLKPHGALYHDAINDVHIAKLIADAAEDFSVPVLHAPQSPIGELLPTGQVIREGFADRRYNENGTLVERTSAEAHLVYVDQVAQQAVSLAMQSPMNTISGRLCLAVDSICLHGDSENAVGKARAVRLALQRARVSIKPFI